MPEHQEYFSVSFLRNNPEKFILACQPIIYVCLRFYIKKKMFSINDMEDLVQTVNEKLITNLPMIADQFNGKAQLRTYIGVIIRNICLRIYRENLKEMKIFPISFNGNSLENDPTTEIFIEEEVERFDTILNLHGSRKSKLLFYAKLYLKISIEERDITEYLPMMLLTDREILIKTFGTNFSHITIEEIFEIAAPIINRCEQKQSTADSHRRTALRYIEQLIKVMNGDPPVQSYNEDSLRTLIEEYFLVLYPK